MLCKAGHIALPDRSCTPNGGFSGLCAGPLCDGDEYNDSGQFPTSRDGSMDDVYKITHFEMNGMCRRAQRSKVSHAWHFASTTFSASIGGRLSLTTTDMTDQRLQGSKLPSKEFLKKPVKWVKETFSRSQSRSTSPQPSASRQENRDGEISSVQQAIVSLGAQDPVIGASAAIIQQGIFMYRCPIDEALSQICR
jgi:hypothetical protein